MDKIKGMTITDNKVTIDINRVLGIDNISFYIKKAILEHAVNNANRLLDIVHPNFTVECINIPTDMNKEDGERLARIIDSFCKKMTLRPNENAIENLMERLHPELSEEDIANIMITAGETTESSENEIYHIDLLLDLVIATKNKGTV